MIPCPNPGCTALLSPQAVACNLCGWERPKENAAQERDPDWWCCCHEDRGQRCAEAGSVSPSTHGTTKGAKHVSGPWFCAAHVPTLQRSDEAAYCAPPMGFDALRKIAGRTTPKPYDFEAEGERLALQNERAEA